MNPLKWAKERLAPFREKPSGVEELALELERSFPEDGFSEPSVRYWFFARLARDVQRSLKIQSIRREGSPRSFTPSKLLDIDDFRDVFRQCDEEREKYQVKGRLYMKLAIERGFTQLELEFPHYT